MASTNQYGRVERLYIDPESRQVFIKFTDQVSALRVSLPPFRCKLTLPDESSQAVNALTGRVFNGNTIVARFYDLDKFEQGIYT